ncbi:hypothetical protein B5G43_05915 [Flavonifractor sp. An92]|uniref:helix-turn-helix domain-containing protein n=1 Tax=Flavonifractor sp. An92 TaxID=1965666 RepID=UPI000B38F9BF|nr:MULTISPECIES: helix-turn-helix transcriptional regulator [unclassified Flavonifractor]OUN07139.1 hypothetical protein B5G43_05915 [Flavonifractor sp. An92]OUQ25696.1 hypothetical protein B5E80_03665 [Flavonifractor sp. An135]
MNRIKELRTAQTPKMSQDKLGKLVGVGRTTVTMWENGSNEPDNATLVKLAEIFGVSVDYLLGKNPEPPSPSGSGTAPADQEQLMAAFWGGDQDLTDEDKEAMWADVKNFAAFIAQKKKQEKQQHD